MQRWDYDLIHILSSVSLNLMVNTMLSPCGDVGRESEPEEAFCM